VPNPATREAESGKTFYLNVLTAWNCTRRRLDAQRVHDYLIANGHRFTSDYRRADYVVLSSCAYLRTKEDRSVRFINFFTKRRKKSSRTLILGCLPDISPRRLEGIGEYTPIPVRNMQALEEAVPGRVRLDDVPDPSNSVSLTEGEPTWLRFFTEFRLDRRFAKQCIRWLNRRFSWISLPSAFWPRPTHVPYNESEVFTLRIGDGCLSACTYCVIRNATGRVKSKPLDAVLGEFRRGLDEGYRIFQITSEDVGAYGHDIGSSIVELLREIFDTPGEFKLIVKYFNARWFTRFYEPLEPILQANWHRIEVLQVPIESGSTKMLKLMKRGYSAEAVRECLERVHRTVPRLKLSTHLVLGFPGEDEEAYGETKRFVQELRLAYAEFFPYSEHPLAHSARLPGKVPAEEIDRRCKEMEEIVAEMRREIAHAGAPAIAAAAGG
jgi:threonylcarbamoyladenosine tRNA methylthiotransferase CDKAL1